MTETRAPVFLPVYLATFGCMAAMMGYVALAGALAQVFDLAPWQIGLTATASGLVWVLSTRAWGQRSDHVGRRPVLVQGVAIFTAAHLLLVLVIMTGQAAGLAGLLMLALLAVLRGIAGLGFGALPPASNAYIADRTAPQDRAGLMARLGAAQALAMIAGPAAVSLLAGGGVVMPLAALAVLPVLALVTLLRGLHEPAATRRARPPALRLSDPRLTRICSISTGAMFCVGIAQIAVGFLAIDRFGLSATRGAQTAGLALTVVGIALIPAQLLVRRLGLHPRALIILGALVSASGFTSVALCTSVPVLLLGYAVSGFGMGWVLAGLSAQAANAVRSDEQGRAAGAVSAALGLGAMLGPLAGTTLYMIAPAAPYLTGSAILTGIAVLGTGLPKPGTFR